MMAQYNSNLVCSCLFTQIYSNKIRMYDKNVLKIVFPLFIHRNTTRSCCNVNAFCLITYVSSVMTSLACSCACAVGALTSKCAAARAGRRLGFAHQQRPQRRFEGVTCQRIKLLVTHRHTSHLKPSLSPPAMTSQSNYTQYCKWKFVLFVIFQLLSTAKCCFTV